MSKRLMWVDDNAIHNGPDIEGYWLIDGGGYEATELQAIVDAWKAFIEAPLHRRGTKRLELDDLLIALAEVDNDE